MIESSIPKKNFPRALEVLPSLLESSKIDTPPEVLRVAQASRKALFSKNPRVSISKQFCGLRGANPLMFPKVLEWLRSDVVEALFSEYGNHWARLELLKAFESMVDGEKPHVAFGMDVSGRPSKWGFTDIEDAVIYAHDLHVNHGYSIDNAKMVAANSFGTDKANINKVKLPKDIPDNDIKTQAEFIGIKHRL